MKIHYKYKQRAIAKISGTLDVPDDIIAEGARAVHEYIRENEPETICQASEIVDWGDEVGGTMIYAQIDA